MPDSSWEATIQDAQPDTSWESTIRDETGVLESAARGFAQGATLGLADEGTAFLESLFTDKTYDESLAESQQAYKEAEEDNPNTFLAGEMASFFVPGTPARAAVGIAVKGAKAAGKKAAKGISKGVKLGKEISGKAGDTAAGLLAKNYEKMPPSVAKALDWGKENVSPEVLGFVGEMMFDSGMLTYGGGYITKKLAVKGLQAIKKKAKEQAKEAAKKAGQQVPKQTLDRLEKAKGYQSTLKVLSDFEKQYPGLFVAPVKTIKIDKFGKIKYED